MGNSKNKNEKTSIDANEGESAWIDMNCYEFSENWVYQKNFKIQQNVVGDSGQMPNTYTVKDGN